jgi:hypothetical protein
VKNMAEREPHKLPEVPENLKGKVEPKVWHDSSLYFDTVVEMAHMGLKAPTWDQWKEDGWSLRNLKVNELPDPLDQVDNSSHGVIFEDRSKI